MMNANMPPKIDVCKVNQQTSHAGRTTERDQPFGSGSSDESGCSSRKRPRPDSLGGGFFDLNLPAEIVDRTDL